MNTLNNSSNYANATNPAQDFTTSTYLGFLEMNDSHSYPRIGGFLFFVGLVLISIIALDLLNLLSIFYYDRFAPLLGITPALKVFAQVEPILGFVFTVMMLHYFIKRSRRFRVLFVVYTLYSILAAFVSFLVHATSNKLTFFDNVESIPAFATTQAYTTHMTVATCCLIICALYLLFSKRARYTFNQVTFLPFIRNRLR